MDKYEYKLKLEQLKNLVAEGDYATAAQMADSINWRKVRNASTLCMVGEIYDQMNRYEDSRELLLMAYDHSPIGRNIVYKLTEIAIKAKDIEAAEDYYSEFSEIAANDTKKYILRYKISQLKNEPLANRISILEELKDKDYTEEWVFELAKMYQEADMISKCVETCDELILWFGDGEYVEKALELKMLYQPLTKPQEEKYRSFRQKQGMAAAVETEEEGGMESAAADAEGPQPAVNASRFNTLNLQEELAKSMQQIMNATEKDAVSDTMDSVKKIVEDIPYLKLLDTEEEGGMNEEIINEQIDHSLKSDFEEFLAEDSDGQISLNVPSSPLLERQITGQLQIEDVLAEWEKTRRAAEAAIAVAEQKKLEVAKRKALQETQDLLQKLKEVTPILEAGTTPKELLEKEYLSNNENNGEEPMVSQPAEENETKAEKEVKPAGVKAAVAAGAAAAAGAVVSEVLEKEKGAAAEEKEPMQKVKTEATEAVQEVKPEAVKATEKAPETDTQKPAEEMNEEADKPEDTVLEPASAETEKTANAAGQEVKAEKLSRAPEGPSDQELDDAHRELLEEIERIAKATAGIDKILNGTLDEEPKTDYVSLSAGDFQESEEIGAESANEDPAGSPEDAVEPEVLKKSIAQATRVMQDNANVEIPSMTDVPLPEDVLADMIEPEAIQEQIKLTEEQRKLFSYFLPVPGMEEQICQVLLGATARTKNITSLAGNIIIQGPEGSGKTVLATSLIKAIQLANGDTGSKIGKISAEALNQKDFSALIPKLAGGYLIIEKAGNLQPETVEHISQVMEGNTMGLVVVMEDTKSGINMVLESNYGFAKKFTEKINIPIFTIDELVDFAKSYAEEMECTIDEMGVLALYNRINNIQKLEHATTLTEVREIVDEAIENAERGGIKKAFGVLFSKKYNENDYLILREKDFEA